MEQRHIPLCFLKFSETVQQSYRGYDIKMVQSFALRTSNLFGPKQCLVYSNAQRHHQPHLYKNILHRDISRWLGSYLSDGRSCHRTLRLPVSFLRRLSRSQHEQDNTLITTQHTANTWLITQYARTVIFTAKHANRRTTFEEVVDFITLTR